MLDMQQSIQLNLDCSQLIEKLEATGNETLAGMIQVLNQKRLKSRVMVEIEAIRSQLRYKQKHNLSADKLKLKNNLKFAAGKYDYIRLGIYKQNWRKLHTKKKSTNASANDLTRNNLVLEFKRKDSYAKNYMLIERYNCFMSQIYTQSIKQHLDLAADTWANTYGFIISEGMSKSNKFHEDVCVFYSKKCELAVTEINTLIDNESAQDEKINKTKLELDNIENDLTNNATQVKEQRDKTKTKRKKYLLLVEDLMTLKRNLVTAKCRLKIERNDVKQIKSANELHYNEINKKLQQQDDLNNDAKDDLQLMMDQLSQLIIYRGKHRHKEEQLEAQIRLRENDLGELTKSIGLLSLNILALIEGVKQKECTKNKSKEELEAAQVKLNDWVANIDYRIEKESKRRARKIDEYKKKTESVVQDGEYFKEKLTKRMKMAEKRVEELTHEKSILTERLAAFHEKLDVKKDERAKRLSDIAAETQSIHQKNSEIEKLNERIATENDATQRLNKLGQIQIESLRQQINNVKLDVMVQARQLAAAEKRCYHVDQSLNDAKNKNEVAVEKLNETTRRFLLSNQSLLNLKSTIDLTQAQVKERTTTCRQLKDQRNDIYHKIKGGMAEFNTLHGQLCDKIATTTAKVDFVKAENGELGRCCIKIIGNMKRAKNEMLTHSNQSL